MTIDSDVTFGGQHLYREHDRLAGNRLAADHERPKSCAELLRCVQLTFFVGRREIGEAWVRIYRETSRLIVSHVLARFGSFA